jgi:parvulin-like peptidyl-prolyl isomerase
VDVKHILIGTKQRSEADAKALADKLYAELKQNPAAFDADVEKYSDDPSKAKNHGLIPDATSPSYVAEFRGAAGKLHKVGEISSPVKSQFGYHILKAVKIVPAQPRSFDQVRAPLVQKLRADYIAQKVQDHIDGVRSRALDADPDLVASLRTRYAKDTVAPAKTGSGTSK